MLGALVYAIAGVRVLTSSIGALFAAIREYSLESGGGGLGAVSFGLSEILIELVLPVAAIVTNRLFVRWARGSGRVANALHRAHSWTIVAAFAILIVGIISFAVRPGPLLFLAIPFDAVVWGLLFLVTAGLLGVYAMQSPRLT
jgi:hypothetical protein